MPTRTVGIPKDKVGLIIGKGGQTLKTIQTRAGVESIRVDNNNEKNGHVAVNIRGRTDDQCNQAVKEIEALVARKKHSKRLTAHNLRHKRNEVAGNKHSPPTCRLCEREINSMASCIHHLQSKFHIEKVGGLCLCADKKCEEKGRPIEALLSCPAQKDAHRELGFQVEAILEALKDGIGQPMIDGGRDEALLLSSDPDWMVLVSRRFVGWNGLKKKGSPTTPPSKAPTIEDCICRLSLDQHPPKFTVPSMPASLPAPKKLTTTKLVYPHKPGASLSLAVLKATGGSLEEVDFIATTNIFYAMWGFGSTMKDTFLVQRLGNSIIVQGQKKTSHMSIDVGILTENLCCPSHAPGSSNYSISRFKVGSHHLMVLSELDAFDTNSGRPVEVKSRSACKYPSTKELVQASANGSSHIAVFQRSGDDKDIKSLAMYSLEEMRERHSNAWIYAGQRIRHTLNLVKANPTVQAAIRHPVIMSFDNSKLPVFTKAGPGCSLIPPDYAGHH